MEIIKQKQLEEAIFAKPWYPMKEKQKIYEHECNTYKHGDKIKVYFGDKEIGHVRRGHLMFRKPFWLVHCCIPSNVMENINKGVYDYEILDLIGFDEEVTYLDHEKIPGKIISGWDYDHSWHEKLKGYATLERAIDDVKCFYRKLIMNEHAIIEKFSNPPGLIPV
jgi:hypothetical protein